MHEFVTAWRAAFDGADTAPLPTSPFERDAVMVIASGGSDEQAEAMLSPERNAEAVETFLTAAKSLRPWPHGVLTEGLHVFARVQGDVEPDPWLLSVAVYLAWGVQDSLMLIIMVSDLVGAYGDHPASTLGRLIFHSS